MAQNTTLPEKQTKVGIPENEEGIVEIHFIEEYRHVYMSPLRTVRQFVNWTDAINFLKMWDTTSYIQWW